VDLVEGLFEPAQIYEAFLVMVGVGLILLFERRPRGNGSSFWLVVLVWGLARFIYEFFRAGTIEEVGKGIASSTYWGSLPITQAQAAALAMVLIGGVMFWLAVRKPATDAQGAA
jgi:prolipoprotein diacylglyceryltransferase